MVSTLRPTFRKFFKKRSKVAKSSQPKSQGHHRLINLLLGRSPKDSSPEATEEVTKWLDGVAGKIEGDPPAKKE